MDYYLVIPIHNEEAFLKSTLDSILLQTKLPKRVILVNDNSTDDTEHIIDAYIARDPIFTKVNSVSSTQHMPGSKVVDAFSKGLKILDDNFEVIGTHFKLNPNLGICGGFIYEQTESGDWVMNHPMDKDHVRGAIKAYSKACFKALGGLKSAMGWDTVDELLAKYHGFQIQTDSSLKIKHLRPTGKAYNPNAKRLQGKAMYTMRYGFLITCIASLKMALKNKSVASFWNNMTGYLNAAKSNATYLVTKEEGEFIRNLRWTNIKRKIKT